MAELTFWRYPVPKPIFGPPNISGRFGTWYTTANGTQYQHRGIDFPVPVGTEVRCPEDGVVVRAHNPDGSFGTNVCLFHGDGYDAPYTLYAHMSKVNLPEGTLVLQGQLLGLSGNTGLSTGPHLHWQQCDTRMFPTNIANSRDPLAHLATEADMATLNRIEQGLSELNLQLAILRGAVAGSETKPGMDPQQAAGARIVPIIQGLNAPGGNTKSLWEQFDAFKVEVDKFMAANGGGNSDAVVAYGDVVKFTKPT